MIPAVLVASLVAASLALASSQGPSHHKDATVFKTTLTGHNEVPAVHTKGLGSLTLTFNADNTISFTLTYANLNAPAQMAHVHFGQPFASGAVSFFFCGGGGKPACPAGNTSTPVTVTGTVAAADIIAVPTQGLAAGDIGAIEQEIKEGFAYANVHTTQSPAGEIRGQLVGDRGHDHGHGDDNDD
jgi:hypothetical protein